MTSIFSLFFLLLKASLCFALVVAVVSVIDHIFFVVPRVKKAKKWIPTPLDGRGFQSKLIPPVIDVIVIGSGIGGLTTACHLARRGYSLNIITYQVHFPLIKCYEYLCF